MVWWLEQKSVDLFPEWPVTHCTTVKVPNFALLLPAAEDQARHHAEKGHSSAATDGLHKAQSHSFAVAAWVLLQELGDTAVQFCYSTAVFHDKECHLLNTSPVILTQLFAHSL